jgi:hypothetical protein
MTPYEPANGGPIGDTADSPDRRRDHGELDVPYAGHALRGDRAGDAHSRIHVDVLEAGRRERK